MRIHSNYAVLTRIISIHCLLLHVPELASTMNQVERPILLATPSLNLYPKHFSHTAHSHLISHKKYN
ncbi:hypothetical protein GLYMA_13G227550v4 [Glycine max]|nr:hypothetical protein GLYMA_13G227550v4 [Glycine max]KAH1102880.1 hypothetical protein GYH30_037075 [Glycine max]